MGVTEQTSPNCLPGKPSSLEWQHDPASVTRSLFPSCFFKSNLFLLFIYSVLFCPNTHQATLTGRRFAVIHPWKPPPPWSFHQADLGILSLYLLIKWNADSWARSFLGGSFRRLERRAGGIWKANQSSVIQQCFSKWGSLWESCGQSQG